MGCSESKDVSVSAVQGTNKGTKPSAAKPLPNLTALEIRKDMIEARI